MVACLSDTLEVVGAYKELEIYFKNLLLQTSKKKKNPSSSRTRSLPFIWRRLLWPNAKRPSKIWPTVNQIIKKINIFSISERFDAVRNITTGAASWLPKLGFQAEHCLSKQHNIGCNKNILVDKTFLKFFLI